MKRLTAKGSNTIRTCVEVIQSVDFSCVGAKAAFAGGHMEFVVVQDLRCGVHDSQIVEALQRFRLPASSDYSSLIVLFPHTPPLTEPEFETFLWNRLQSFHQLDRTEFPWDPTVSQDPSSPSFGFSIGGQAFFVVGMHPEASRKSRRMPFPILAFNAHSQFRRLRNNGGYGRVQKATRARETALQGFLNPMLADYGTQSEARQYSGRQLNEQWACPFQPGGKDGKTI